VVRTRAGATLALARSDGSGCQRALDVARPRRLAGLAATRVSRRCRLHARGKIEFVSSATLIAYLFAAMLLVLASGHDTLALILFVALVTSTLAIAWRTDAAALAVPAAAIFVTLI